MKMKCQCSHPRWEFIDQAICICVQYSHRFPTVRKKLHRVGLCSKVLFYRPLKDKDNPFRGAWTSHHHVVNTLITPSKRTLVLEDDVYFDLDLLDATLPSIKTFFKKTSKDPYDAFLLGHLPLSIHEEFLPNIYRVQSVLMHAYIPGPYLKFPAFDDYFQKILVDLPHLRTLDWHVLRCLSRVYAIYPMSAFQKTDSSQISKGWFLQPIQFFWQEKCHNQALERFQHFIATFWNRCEKNDLTANLVF